MRNSERRPKPPAAGKGRPKGALNKTTREVKNFAVEFLASPAYMRSAKRRVLKGEAPHLETLWHHYAYGKPKETVLLQGAIPPFVVRVESE